MNKDKFFKFFEIGKLDKGLFRIWIILLIPYFIFGYLEIKDQNTYYKNFDYNEESVTVSNNEYCKGIQMKKYIISILLFSYLYSNSYSNLNLYSNTGSTIDPRMTYCFPTLILVPGVCPYPVPTQCLHTPE